MTTRDRFHGRIAGAGSASGVRVVVGRWDDGPWGSFADVMLETAAGHRVLLAPDRRVAEFVAATYSFDEVRVEPVTVTDTDAGWRVDSPSLRLDLRLGRRTPLGWLLRSVPARVAASPAFCTLTDPVSRVLLRGVRTRGTAGQGRREWYGATDRAAVTGLEGAFDGADLGDLRPVDPACRFGFSSTPKRPGVTTVVTTVAGLAPRTTQDPS